MLSPRTACEELEDGSSAYLRALVTELALLMERRAYRRHMQPLLSLRQRAHLWALRNQALFGDAPEVMDQSEPAKESNVSGGTEVSNDKGGPVKASKEAAAEKIRFPGRPRHWYQFTERLYYNAWIELRGVMSPHVAAETFCTEFFYLLKAFPASAMLPVMESALNSARAKASESDAVMKKRGMHAVRYGPRPSEEGKFFIRGCQGDPVVIAFVWLCRAHCIPCEVLFEPLGAAPGEHDAFLVRAPQVGAVLTDPLAAFSLCVEMYLPDGEHWMGILPQSMSQRKTSKSRRTSHSSICPDVTLHAQRAMDRSMWMEYMKHIETDLRAPLLRYIREAQCQEKRRESEASGSRSATVKVGNSQVAQNREHVSRLSKLSQEAMGSLLRYERFAAHYYAARPEAARNLASVAELCVASYAFVLCTNPNCKMLLPLVECTVPSLCGTNDPHNTAGSSVPTCTTKAAPSGAREGIAEDAVQLHRVPPASRAIARRILNEQFSSVRSSLSAVVGVACSDHRLLPARRVASSSTAAAPGASEAAVDAVDALIRAKCTPVRQCLAELFAQVWVTTNEQCIGFPFLVLDGEQERFLTSPANAEVAANTIARAPWSGGHGISLAKLYWEKLRTVFGLSTSPSYELRMYRNPAARL